ncbi:O-antigen ligase family protein [Xanthomarina sp. F2636L]|uniref:O-antigen ligase family protein n=1 Tax=Xanthomarina sp. F2636L TaxID=2996018 RepID=UPI00225DE9F6|nr:O-antigen ligase family protein [Xanthomarina sp. F2636L]MCX7549508.1 O-antigen ligase family protein [Xanthomarina sp. F2636L]
MKILKYILLSITLLNLVSFSPIAFGSSAGSLVSALFFILIIFYYFVNPKPKLVVSFIVLGLAYHLIAGIGYTGEIKDFYLDATKFFIFIIGIVYLAKDTTHKELFIFAFIGSMSILINAVSFSSLYGRYGGFYINPNSAGIICLIAFSLTFNIKNTILKLGLQLLIVIAGIMTLSRYFILLLVVVNLIAIISNRKNSISLVAGTFAIVLVLTVSSLFNLNTVRFSAFQSIFGGGEVETKTITENSRNETWALYTDLILDNPVTGVGYNVLSGKKNKYIDVRVGVHNTYLMIIGESGIIPFLLIIIIYLSLIFRSIKHLSTNPEYACIAVVLATFLLASHNYFDNFLVLFTSIWLYQRVKEKPETLNTLIP